MYSIEHVKITDEPLEFNFSGEVLSKLEKFHKIIKQGKKPKKNAVDELLKCIQKYPTIPQFYDHLYNIYILLDRSDKAYELLKKMTEKFPYYLFGKVRLATNFADNNEIEKAENVLNNAININELIPDRAVYHFSEIVAFYGAKFHIELAKKNFYQAEILMRIIKEVEQSKSSMLRRKLHDAGFEYFYEKSIYLEKNHTKIVSIAINNKESPTLQNSILNTLITDNFISNESIVELLTLDRESFINDLILVLQDTENRYPYYLKNRLYNTSIYVLALLKEIEAEDSLENVLEFLKCDQRFLDFWFDDIFTEFVWQVIYAIGKNRLQLLHEFLKLPSIYTFSKEQVLLALCKIYKNYPEKQPEIELIFDDLLDYYASETLPEMCVDFAFFAFFVGYVYYINEAFIQKITVLYEQNKIDLSLYGTYQEFLSEKDENEFKKYKVEDIYEINEFIHDNEQYYNEEDEEDFAYEYNKENDKQYKEYVNEEIIKNLTQQTSFQNIERNDPCPCGSGKKFKKCCLN